MSTAPQNHTTRNAIGAAVSFVGILYFTCPWLFMLPLLAAFDRGLISSATMVRMNFLFYPLALATDTFPAYKKFLDREGELDPTGLVRKYKGE